MNLKLANFGSSWKCPAQEKCEMMDDDTVRETHFRHYQTIRMGYLEIGDDKCRNKFVLCFGLFIWHIYCYFCIYGAANMLRTTSPQLWRCPPLYISSINFRTPREKVSRAVSLNLSPTSSSEFGRRPAAYRFIGSVGSPSHLPF